MFRPKAFSFLSLQLRSMDRLIQHLLPHNQTIEVILANDNQMQELPRLPPGTFPRITVISLVRNRIEKVCYVSLPNSYSNFSFYSISRCFVSYPYLSVTRFLVSWIIFNTIQAL